ncbi:PspC domain-containing protein [Cellulomonas sp. IC4_254]|uniref:PspC domain-containing protein n=1 Tax=Cellulomonas sp. IC4_254 TaxID=2714040 RepID=UPI00141F7976|nr:PspC domain-containing protein [Cellulomonas sp. IC4_254]NHT18659.1 PspC domain-containing protein [Cellulomonas sp. IC4_254]
MTNDSADRGSGTVPPSGPGAPGPVPPPAPPTDGHAMAGFFAAIRRAGISRSQDRWVGGVSGGLAARLGIDPLLARGLVGVTLLMGFGFVLYGLAWALLPEESDGRIHLEETIRGNFDVALLGAIALVVVGFSAGDWWFSWGPFRSGWFSGFAWFAAVVAGIVVLVTALRRGRDGRPPAASWQPPYPEGQRPMTSPSTPPAPPADTARPAPYAGAAPAAPDRPVASASAPVGGGYGSAPAAPAYGTAPSGQPSAGSGARRHQGPPNPPAPPVRGWTPPPPTPPTPPRPPRPPRRGPGAAVTGVVVALILIGLAGLLAAERAGVYDGPIAAVVVGGGLALVGLAIIVSGLRGRTAGGLTALAIVGMVVAGPAAVANDARWGSWDRWDGDSGGVRSIDTAVSSRAVAERGYSFGVGDATVDLTGVPLTDEPLEVPISGGLGDVTVIVPEGAAVVADVSSGAGNVIWKVDGKNERSDGVGHARTFTSDAMSGREDAEIELTIEVGVGSITIEED